MSKILNIDSFCEKLKEVETSKIIDTKGKFNPKGLFSLQIFGPIENYVCGCGKYHGISYKGGRCPTCGVDITSSNERRRRYAKISLPIKIVNPLMYDLVTSVMNAEQKQTLNYLMKNDKSLLCKKDNNFIIKIDDEEFDENDYDFIYEKNEAIYEFVVSVLENEKKRTKKQDGIVNLLRENVDRLLISNVIVLPADLRPASEKSNKNKYFVDKINSFYTILLTNKEAIDKNPIDINLKENKKMFYNHFNRIQKCVNELYDYILASLSKKEGLIRQNILGKRIDFSGRAIIIPNPVIKLDECVLPYLMFLELFKIKIAKYLIDINKFKLLNQSIDFIDKCIDENNSCLFELCKKLCEGEVCLLNRQPSLHRLSILGFKIKLHLHKVIGLHPLVCPCFNSDYDGDQMAVYIPISEKSKKEIYDKFLVTKNFINPANGLLSTTPGQDIVLGIYLLTGGFFKDLNEKDLIFKNNESIEINKNFKIFNSCLPTDYPLILESVGKKELISILNDIKDHYSEDVIMEVLDNIKKIGYLYSTLYGQTLSLSPDDINNDECIKYKNKIFENDDINKQIQIINNEDTKNFLRKNFKASYLIDSGSRASWEQMMQILLCRGFVSNFKGEIYPHAIKSSLIDGLTPNEFFISTFGARKGLLDIALKTGTSGYISRKLIFSCANLQKSNKLNDCGTKDYLDVCVDSMKKAEMLLYRYYLNNGNLQEITKENYKDIINKKIKLRSPIFCKSEEICDMCYGNLKLNSRFIGIIAAQSLGEHTSQKVLETFHNSLQKSTRILDINNNSYTIEEVYNKVKSGEDFYTFSCSPDGYIEVSKVIDAYRDRFEKKMIRITLDNDKFIECTLEHKFIMRNGEEKEAKDLNINDSLMPIYFGDDKYGYRTIKQNYIPKFHKKCPHKFIFHLSSNHKDIKKHNLLNNETKLYRHHIDENKKNDYPSNILLINQKYHLPIHKNKSEMTQSGKQKISESNKRRTKNPEFIKKFNEKRNKTMKENNIYETISKYLKEKYKNDPIYRREISERSRTGGIKIVINKIKELKLNLTNENYDLIRLDFKNNGKRYPTFEYAYNCHFDLVKNFTIINKPIINKSHNQLQAEFRANKIYNEMINLGLEINELNFEFVNKKIYPKPKSRWSLKAILKLSPNCYDFLKKNHKVKNIEVINLPEYEEFYDLKVDSKYPNFSLESGIFIHNSGVAKTDKNIKNNINSEFKQKDIIADLSAVSSLLHKPQCKDISDLVYQLFEVFNYNGKIHHVHIESVISQLLWSENEKWRLLENRDDIKPCFCSIQSTPAKESWILGLGFAMPKRNILCGLVQNGFYKGIFDKILTGKLS